MKKYILSLSMIFIFRLANAQVTNGQFDVVDLSGSILGEPQVSQDSARNSWNEACRDWKKETKELNKNNEILGINCSVPSCSFLDSGKTQCTSTGTYQVKTAGTRVDNSSSAPVVQTVEPTVVSQPPPQVITVQPQVIYEQAPPPRVGFLWVPGFWGWEGYHHHRTWHGGYWRSWHRG